MPKQYIFSQAQRHGLTSWMEEMDIFLHAEDPTKGDLPTLQAQLEESSVSQWKSECLGNPVFSDPGGFAFLSCLPQTWHDIGVRSSVRQHLQQP